MTDSQAVARLRASACLIGLALLASSCAHGLAFAQDRRLEITRPKGSAKVTLPLTVRWSMKDFSVTGPDGNSDPNAGYFAVFLDRSPVPPGKPLSWITRDDVRCRRIPGCPDEGYLEDRHVYATSDTELVIRLLPDLGTNSGRETHEVTVILLDGRGRRIGEKAWYKTFFFDRKEQAR
jgi:hypothetical protein